MADQGARPSLSPATTAVSEAILAVAAEQSVERVLDRLVRAARDLAGARYAAIGVPDDADPQAFAQFLTAGMSDELIDELGELPRTHGMLGATLVEREPFRSDDITLDPRFRGWWPAAHPMMRSFLGVPIVRHEQILGAFYLTDKQGAPSFTEEDQHAIQLLGAHAALAIEHAQLHEEGRERSITEERNRLARELHDSLNQLLFSLSLTVEAAAGSVRRDPEGAARLLVEVGALAGEAQAELRTLVQGLRPPDLDADGLVVSLRKRAALLARAYSVTIEVITKPEYGRPPPGLDPSLEREAYRVVQEALSNALRHGHPDKVTVTVGTGGGAGGGPGTLVVTVADDGVGFDPHARRGSGRRLGLVTMGERAEAAGGRVSVRSQPGHGTTVTLEVPVG